MAPGPASADRRGLEHILGARLPVWLGHAALALAVAFLVKFTFDRDLLSPAVRVGLGLVAGIVRLARTMGVAALVLLFGLVTLEVRQAFQGGDLPAGAGTEAEVHAYSIAWVLLGTVLLAVGIATRGIVVRWASLAVMLLAVGKVFLYDTRELRDLYRVFSLVDLGLSLLPLAWLYQRFVFRSEER